MNSMLGEGTTVLSTFEDRFVGKCESTNQKKQRTVQKSIDNEDLPYLKVQDENEKKYKYARTAKFTEM